MWAQQGPCILSSSVGDGQQCGQAAQCNGAHWEKIVICLLGGLFSIFVFFLRSLLFFNPETIQRSLTSILFGIFLVILFLVMLVFPLFLHWRIGHIFITGFLRLCNLYVIKTHALLKSSKTCIVLNSFIVGKLMSKESYISSNHLKLH